ncbi:MULTISPECIES: hypothetical protein [Aphanothece]|uniref:hypothetical protein n=1 Tax=Aphanothece TaxID=1121 RepID=UPI0039850C4D
MADPLLPPRPARFRLASILGGALLTTGLALGWEGQAKGADLVLSYSFSQDITFSYYKDSQNNPETSSLSGSFSLNCGPLSALECVTSPGTAADPTQVELTNVQINQPATTFTAGYYFDTAANSYFLEFRTKELDTGGKGQALRIALANALPPGEGQSAPYSSIGLITTGSFYCKSTDNNIGCPGQDNPSTGQTGQIFWFSPGASVNLVSIKIVPAPFSLLLLAPAALISRLRRRYTVRTPVS